MAASKSSLYIKIIIPIILGFVNYAFCRHFPRYQQAENPEFREELSFPSFTELGQIGGLAIDNDGKLHIFHRCHREWNYETFLPNHKLRDETIIPNNTIMVVDPVTGAELYSWGSDTFGLPHGIFVDYEGNTWTTDVGLHQVMKFPAHDSKPSLIIGEKFAPGNGPNQLCQPTDVVVTKSGYVYISDGYCNSRILIYSLKGELLRAIGTTDRLHIPHSLALIEEYDAICVADRENRRILCYSSGLNGNMPAGILLGEIQGPSLGRVYAIRKRGSQILALTGMDLQKKVIPHGTVFDMATGIPTATFQPNEKFVNPHDMAISNNGNTVFVGELDLNSPRRIYKFKVQD